MDTSADSEKKDIRILANDVMLTLFENFIKAEKADDYEMKKDALEDARIMSPVIKQYQQGLSIECKQKELDQKEREFEYKKTVTDPFEQNKVMAELGLKSRYLDLVEKGKNVGNFKLPNFNGDEQKAITTTNSEDVVADVTFNEG